MQLDSFDPDSIPSSLSERRGVRRGVAGVLLLGLLGALLACERAGSDDVRVEAEAPVSTPVGAAAEPPGATAEAQGQGSYREDGFELSLEPPASAEVGKPATATIVLQAKAPYKVNQEYPIKLTLSESPGLTFPAPKVGKEAVTLEAKQALMKVQLTPKSAGTHTLAGRFSFSVCTDERCLIEKRDLAVSVVAR